MPEWAGDIVYEAAERHGVTAEDVVSTSRRVQIVDARAEAMYRIYEMRKLWPSVSTTKIGGWFDRDYTSVSHLIARHGEEFGLPRLVANYSRLRQGRSPQ
jgi:chromosomal replication initiation ATPase DnaA